MAIQSGHGCLVAVLTIDKCIRLDTINFYHQYAILDGACRSPVEHASAVVLHLSLLKVKVLGLVVCNPNLKFLWLLTSVLRFVGWPGKGQVLDP